MRCAVALAALAVACGGGATYLGAPLPPSCARSLGACELDLQVRGMLDVFPPRDEALRAYAARIADRIARVSSLARTPPVLLFPEGSGGVIGTSIVLGREHLVRFGSEAELAAVIAHEIAHLEGGLSAFSRKVIIDDDTMRVLEGAADERATLLLSRAGYPPGALARALGAVSDEPSDARHPRREVRVRRLSLLADPNAPGDDGRARYLAAIAGAPVGGDPERRVGDAFVFVHAGLTVPLPAGVTSQGVGRPLQGSDERTRLHYETYSIGARSADALIARLGDRHRLRVASGDVIVGRPPVAVSRDLSRRAQLLEGQLRSLWGLAPRRTAVAVVTREHEAVLLVVEGDDPMPAVEAWATLVRLPTEAERVATTPARIVLVRAPRAGTIGDLVAACVDPKAARTLDDPHRSLAAGELFKCTDRVTVDASPK